MVKRIISILVALVFLLSGCTNNGFLHEYPNTTREPTANDSTDSIDTNVVVGTDTDNQTFDTTGNETDYVYMNFVGWEYPNNTSAKTYFYSSDLIFEEGDTVDADSLIGYYLLFEMMNPDTHELYEHLIQYKINADTDDYREKNGICIPKEIVNSVIEKHFAVKVDGSDSQYTHPENDDCYLLLPDAMGGLSVSMKGYEFNGTRSVAVYALYDSIDKRIFREVEICIENENSEDDFKIVYVREIESTNIRENSKSQNTTTE